MKREMRVALWLVCLSIAVMAGTAVAYTWRNWDERPVAQGNVIILRGE